MKRTVAFFLSIVLLISPGVAFAEGHQMTIVPDPVLKAAEDAQVLSSQSLNEIVNIESDKKVDRKIDGDYQIETVKVLTKTSIREMADDIVVEGFEERITQTITPFATSSRSDSIPDSSYSCRIYVTIYFDRITVSGKPYIKLSRATTRVSEPSPYSVVVTGSTMTIGASGIGTNGRTVNQTRTQNGFMRAHGGSYTMYPPSSWIAIADTQTNKTNVGAYAKITFRRGTSGSTWSNWISLGVYHFYV